MSSNDIGAVSAYAPLRRNSFLEHPPTLSTSTTLTRRLSTLSVGLALVIIRFWNDARIWRELVARLPETWRNFLVAYLEKWRHGSLQTASTKTRELLAGLQKRLAPFLAFSPALSSQSASLLMDSPNNKTMAGKAPNAGSGIGDAPTSILCDASSTQFTQPCWSDHYEDRIRQNQSLIRRVLAYWFGQFDPDTAQKKLWMIAAQCKEYRATVDSEITELFTPLLCELATAGLEDTDASSDHDSSEAAKYDMSSQPNQQQQQQQQPSSCRWQQWCADKDMYGYQGKLAAIIVLDQFSRHIRRHHEETSGTLGALPPQEILDRLALRTAHLFTEAHEPELKCGMIPLPQFVFGLMPYRHASTLESVRYVQIWVEQAASLNQQLEDMTSRFRKATNRRMAILQDEARRTGKPTTVHDNPTELSAAAGDAPGQNVGKPNQQSAMAFSDEDILEAFPFEADMADAGDHVVVKAIRTFLADRGILPIRSSQESKEKKGFASMLSDKERHQKTTFDSANASSSTHCSLIVSLSGGVDSMVIASVLAYLKSGPYPHLNIVAIHIDYANRPESKAESDFVEQYCGQHGIRFVVRRIEEVTRGITARDEYEKRARQVRYDMYRNTVAEERARLKDNVEKMVVGVMLGHHRGDLRENVLSNAHKGCGPLDLSGMTAVSQNDGVTIFRPLLPLEKTSIFDYAHRYGVPYFKDTTPHWSTRGKLRNKLLPLLEEIYGVGSMNNLSTLATESDECRKLLHDALLKPFMDRVVRYPMGIRFETAPFIAQGAFFWKVALREVLHTAGLGMFTDKSVISFLERVNPQHTCKKAIREGWLQCRKDYAVYLQADGRVYVFYPNSFPWRKSERFNCFGLPVDVLERKTIAVGPWIVQAEVCDVGVAEKQTLVTRKAVHSMDHFMTGYLEYYLQVPYTPAAETLPPVPVRLAFAPKLRKGTRPPAWKNIDEKIQDTLPLLSVSLENEVYEPAPEQAKVMVRVTLDRRFPSDS